MHRLNVQYQKLQDTVLRLQQKDHDMFQKCVAAQLSKDLSHAQLYASECAEIRKMAKIVLESEIALERAIIRLQTVEQLGEILVQMLPVVSVVNETRGKIEGVIPEVASELDAVHSLLDDTVRETGMIQQTDSEIVLRDEEAKRIFEESSVYAEEQIRKQFPELPSAERKQETTQEFESVDLAETMLLPNVPSTTKEVALESEGVIESLDPEVQELPSRVYGYINDHVRYGGKLNLTECAKTLGFQRDDIVKAVQLLCKEGKIVLRQCSQLGQAPEDKASGETHGI